MAHNSTKLQKITYFNNQKQVILRARKLYKRTTEFIQRTQVPHNLQAPPQNTHKWQKKKKNCATYPCLQRLFVPSRQMKTKTIKT